MPDLKFEKKFHIQLDKGEVTLPLKVQRWAEKRGDGLGIFVTTFVVPWLKKVWVYVKTKKTMASVDRQAETLVTEWEAEDPSMKDPVYSEKQDATNPLGISEMRISSPWDTDSDKET
jgi:hypothetical protein